MADLGGSFVVLDNGSEDLLNADLWPSTLVVLRSVSDQNALDLGNRNFIGFIR